jgi:hypothetical protein
MVNAKSSEAFVFIQNQTRQSEADFPRGAARRRKKKKKRSVKWVFHVKQVPSTHIFQLLLQQRNHVLLDNNALLIQILYDKVVVLAINVDNNGLDGRIALNEHACSGLANVTKPT